ncbi:hypothetical protein [Streptomyces cadmiisoli]|uniref:hypothetical protein n=1 Tax=Streptomyces cadmiisoli TaxID=2184053 RepID=UPI003D734555
MVFKIATRGDQSAEARNLAAQDLWQTCRRSTAVRIDNAGLTRVNEDVYAGIINPALGPHDTMRLRGCIEDATTNRASALVIGQGNAGPTRQHWGLTGK